MTFTQFFCSLERKKRTFLKGPLLKIKITKEMPVQCVGKV
jgi:hypothetical protein